jgi:hypothetical protein
MSSCPRTSPAVKIAHAMAEGYLLFLSKPSGYVLVEREGEPPPPGGELEEGGEQLQILKIGPSPIPGDRRRCAFSEPA